jgi:hypothetical protein
MSIVKDIPYGFQRKALLCSNKSLIWGGGGGCFLMSVATFVIGHEFHPQQYFSIARHLFKGPTKRNEMWLCPVTLTAKLLDQHDQSNGSHLRPRKYRATVDSTFQHRSQ